MEAYDPPFRLLDLPPELRYRVVEDSDAHELNTLAQVCKELRPIALSTKLKAVNLSIKDSVLLNDRQLYPNGLAGFHELCENMEIYTREITISGYRNTKSRYSFRELVGKLRGMQNLRLLVFEDSQLGPEAWSELPN